jgi:hypothetical protein
MNASKYIVVNDGQFVYPVRKSALRAGDTEKSVRAMSGDEYAAWCQDVPADFAAAGGSVGSQECIDFCEALIEAGADQWHVGEGQYV